MPIVEADAFVQPSALWPQGDIRDPLGVWGARVAITQNASGSGLKATVKVAAGLNAAYIYTCYSANIVQITGTANPVIGKCRLLCNWPNISDSPGVQAYSTAQFITIDGSNAFSQPVEGPNNAFLIHPNDRFVLLFDPRPGVGELSIMELAINENTGTLQYSFEAYGYFWDRSVLNAPGGPRHPGSN